MHIAVTWDISASDKDWDAINEQIRGVLNPYSWARPLSTLYVVKINGKYDRDTIRNRLTKIASSAMQNVNFVVSPIMSGGKYDGYLPENMWGKINERTDG